VKVIAALTGLVVCLSASAPAQEVPGSPRARPTFRSAAALVALNVTVQDRSSKFVRDLQSEDFVVYEDGVKQDVQFCESSRVPVDLIALIDTSLSMRDKLPAVHEAASAFLKTLRPGDRGAVVSFATTVSVVQPLTSDQAQLEAAVRSTKAYGETSLNNAVYIALKTFGQAMRQNGEVRRQAIVLLSDGADTSSVVSFDDVIALARQMGVSIYTVSLQSQGDQKRQEMMGRRGFEAADTAMKELAKETGAQTFFPSPTSLKDVYASIAAEVASQYSIGYIPANTRSDGTFRRVNVQVVTRPDLRSRTRLGYTAGSGVSSSAAPSAGGFHER
jgi:Ca-activated chloride channel family protein